MSGTVILVPRRSDPERDKIWTWVRRWWGAWTGLPVFEGWHYEHEGPFNRSAALNRAAVEAGDWSVAVVIDADVLVAPGQVEEAIVRASSTGGPVQAYTERLHLGPAGTRTMMGQCPVTINLRLPAHRWRSLPHERMPDSCSGALVVTRTLWDETGGFDERFVGWGYEDLAAKFAFETISGLEMPRIHGLLFHLFHTVAANHYPASPTVAANKEHCDRYAAAHRDREAMAALLTETWRKDDADAAS